MRDRSFERVYYFKGDDDFLKESTSRELMDAVLDPATRDFNLEVLRGDEATAEGLDTAVSTPPMFAERRMVVVREVSDLRKDVRAALDRYLKQPAPDVVLLLVDQEAKTKSTSFKSRVRGSLVAEIRAEIAAAGAGTKIPEFKLTTRNR